MSCFAVAGASVCVAAYLAVQNTWLDVEHFKINLPKETGSAESIRIVHISDMHLPKTASRIDKLALQIRAQRPDIIVVTGDLIDCRAHIESSALAKLCQRLRQIAPVYAVTGNHEFRNGNVQDWKSVLKRSGVIIVDNTFAIFEKDGKEFAVMGLSNGMPYDMDLFNDIEKIESLPKILLAHHPELFGTYTSKLNEIRPDLIFSGHAHGGQVRLPFIGGLAAPGQGFFPKYTSGIYESENGIKMIVSRGIGSSQFPFRVNNRPHLPVVTLSCGGTDE